MSSEVFKQFLHALNWESGTIEDVRQAVTVLLGRCVDIEKLEGPQLWKILLEVRRSR